MIRVDTGEFKLNDYKLIIHPELTLSEFKSGDIPIKTVVPETKQSGVYSFLGWINELQARFQINFAAGRLRSLRFAEDIVLYDQKMIDEKLFAATRISHEAYLAELKKWIEITAQADREQKDKQDAWLHKVIGPPPYEYSWGEIISMVDPREGDVEILVRFRHSFGEVPDLRKYFENRRKQEQTMNPPKPFIPGQLPPGFSRKA